MIVIDDSIPSPSELGLAFAPGQAGGEAPECAGTCLYLTRQDDCVDKTPTDLCHEIRSYCESSELTSFCALAGVLGVNFTWNPYLIKKSLLLHRKQPSKLYQQFWSAYEQEPKVNLALGFHGTSQEANIPKILKHGLDPTFRRTQAFGQGEYFAKEPGLSASYSGKGVQKLLLFLVLLPADDEKIYSQKDRDIMVVPKIHHQLPIGVVSFESVDKRIVEHTQHVRLQQRSLKDAAVAQQRRVRQAEEEKQWLEQQAREAWKAYWTMKLDEHRNHHPDLHLQKQPQQQARQQWDDSTRTADTVATHCSNTAIGPGVLLRKDS